MTPPSREQGLSQDWWKKRSYENHETQDDGQVLGYKRQARRPPRVISAQVWSVKPLNLLLCHRDANDDE